MDIKDQERLDYRYLIDEINLENSQNLLRKNYNDIYIPSGLFQKIGSQYGWFRYSKLLGVIHNRLYFSYYETINNQYTMRLLYIDLNNYDYSVFAYSSWEENIYYTTLCTRVYGLNTRLNNPVFTYDQFNCISDNYTRFNQSIFFGTNYQPSNGYTMHVGQNALDDFLYSTKSTDIFIMGLYFFIPLLLFILAIKVLRKGLFK